MSRRKRKKRVMGLAAETDPIDWKARDDANALAQANEVHEDPGRHRRAKEEASKLADESEKRAHHMRKAASMGELKKSARKPRRRREESRPHERRSGKGLTGIDPWNDPN